MCAHAQALSTSDLLATVSGRNRTPGLAKMLKHVGATARQLVSVNFDLADLVDVYTALELSESVDEPPGPSDISCSADTSPADDSAESFNVVDCTLAVSAVRRRPALPSWQTHLLYA